MALTEPDEGVSLAVKASSTIPRLLGIGDSLVAESQPRGTGLR